MTLYNRIGIDYDTTRRADGEICRTLAALLGELDGQQILDVACGTGNYTGAVSQFGGRWTGCDLSATMLDEARHKSTAVGWVQADVSQLPFAPASYDLAMTTLAIHHYDDLPVAFAEVGRVLKPGGRWVIFTATPEQMHHYWLSRYFPGMMAHSAQQMPGLQAIGHASGRAGLNLVSQLDYQVSPTLEDFFLYSGKHRPEMYLQASVRAGISSFRELCDIDELTSGLEKLEKHLASGDFHRLNLSKESGGGDYLFLVLEKSRT